MLSYCFKCRRNTESINPKTSKTTNGIKNQNLLNSKKQKDYSVI